MASWEERNENASLILQERNLRVWASCERCPAGEAAVAAWGLRWVVRSSADIDAIHLANLDFLARYDAPATAPAQQALVSLRAIVSGCLRVTVAELLVEGVASDLLYSAIAHGALYVDLHDAPLIDPTRVWVYPDVAAAGVYSIMQRESGAAEPVLHERSRLLRLNLSETIEIAEQTWTVISAGEFVRLCDAEGHIEESPEREIANAIRCGLIVRGELSADDARRLEALQLLTGASTADSEEAMIRCEILSGQRTEHPTTGPVPARTQRAWRKRGREAQLRYRNAFVGYLPLRRNSGRRGDQLPKATRDLLESTITEHFTTLKQLGLLHAYAIFVALCDAKGVTPIPTPSTFVRAVRKRDPFHQIRGRRGPRAAYAVQPTPHRPRSPLTTPNGNRAWERAYLDHTQADIELVSSMFLPGAVPRLQPINLGRPWLTLLVDAYTRLVLAQYLTFDPPSYRSLMMAIRDCVQLWGRLPETCVVDWGPEFGSVYFQSVMHYFGSGIERRPAHEPRYGAVGERMFGTASSQFFHCLQGNTQIMLNVREVTKSVDPAGQAVCTLPTLEPQLRNWLDLYHHTPHPALDQTPLEAYEASLAIFGEQARDPIEYDDDFLMWSLPSTARGTAKVVANKGVKLLNLFYRCRALDRVVGQSMDVRFDPFNRARACAYVHTAWQECESEYAHAFRGRTQREVELASQELRQRAKARGDTRLITTKQLGDFLLTVDDCE
jgi:putative transposase